MILPSHIIYLPAQEVFPLLMASSSELSSHIQLNNTNMLTSRLVLIGLTQSLIIVCRRGLKVGTSFIFNTLPYPIGHLPRCCPHLLHYPHFCHCHLHPNFSDPPPPLQLTHHPPYDQFHIVHHPRRGPEVGNSFLFHPLPLTVDLCPSRYLHCRRFPHRCNFRFRATIPTSFMQDPPPFRSRLCLHR